MTSIFNPEAFLNATHEGGFETRRPIVPEGEYPAQILPEKDGLDAKPVNTKNGTRLVLSLGWEILDDGVRAATGLDKPRVKQDVWLDLDANGHLVKDKTHNIDLGRLLSGLGLNSGSWTPNQIRSVGVCKVKVVAEPDKEKKNPDDTPVIYNRVVAAVRMG